MTRLKRRIVTVYPPVSVALFVAISEAVGAEYPDATLDSDEGRDAPVHLVVTEDVEDDDPRLIRPTNSLT